MYYIKVVACSLLVLLAGCSTQPTVKDPDLPKNIPKSDPQQELKNTTAAEISEYKKAMLHLKNGKLEDAKAVLIEFIGNRPSLAGPWANLGLVYLKQNQLDKAEDAIKKALLLNPKQAHALCLLGFLESKKGNFLEAEKNYIKAIELKDNYPVAHYNLALLYDIYFQDIGKAVKHYSIYLKLTGNQDKKTADWLEHLKGTLKKG